MADKEISLEEIKKIAQLANLHLSDDQLQTYQAQLSNILDYVQQLQEIDTEDVPETSQVTGLENVSRTDDTGIRILSMENAISQAPKTHDNYIQVPQILTNRDE